MYCKQRKSSARFPDWKARNRLYACHCIAGNGDSRIWRLNRSQSASDARADGDRRSNRPSPTHRFCHSSIFRPITPYNVWFFWVSRHRSIILAKKMETFSGRFWEIPGNVLKLELLKMLIDHKNTWVFFQAVSGMSSWSFSYRWTQYQWEKTATKHQFIALLAGEVKNKDVFSASFSFECPFSTPLKCNISSKYPT